MHFLYNIVIRVSWAALHVVAWFSPKIKLFVHGRKNSWDILCEQLPKGARPIWVHAASLGEYEQGVPIIEGLKKNYPDIPILLTFFSPSGYEVKKKNSVADTVCYLPMDTASFSQRFIREVNPKMALFIKYEIWPNYLKILKEKQIPTFLISAIFKPEQIYFKGYGGLMRKALDSFQYFYVQDEQSKKLLESIGKTNVNISGDTRLDRVSQILEQDNQLDFMDRFCQDKSIFIAGSTWPEDENVLLPWINEHQQGWKFVIAPHNIKPEAIDKIKGQLQKPVMLYSERQQLDPALYEVLILDTIGILTKVYSYAHLAYVGGGFATGLHNVLEPAVFGIPVLIGPVYVKFKEAEDLVGLGGVISVANGAEFNENANLLISNTEKRKQAGQIAQEYILSNKGAAQQILESIDQQLGPNFFR
ncbi:3-deoxy-D-manno-octulosonic acid transferase [Sediminicola luteus]|uniref:3-deoxy-D-manno-octulosonic acid transferase n=1 Tax=Sediminicola luteus TaxID=319238 RepID=A0A2A4G3C3_9FLAO|nr:glycosyltransferase N-terminal domain-containing protein [Sediminicola luteus]PCE63177.1 3-deoxy-D-manno-octulosonic acid transferase [Sediminicola luteus]